MSSFSLAPQKLVYGGGALGYHEGRTVLVPRGLPGEQLEVEEVRTAKGILHARPLRVLNASPDRVDAPCPYFGRCGGCQYQHFNADKQARAKREILRETLRRIGKIPWEGDIPIHAASPWNYRNQAELKVTHTGDGQSSVGFFEAESHKLVPVRACLILSPLLNSILSALASPAWTNASPGFDSLLIQCREIDQRADDRDEKAMLTLRGRIGRVDGENLATELLDALPGVETIAIDRGGGAQVFGKPALLYEVGGLRYQISPGSFFQASRFLLPDLVAAVVGEEPGSLALDLYSGVGLFTLPLARRFAQVISVEANPGSAADLVANVRAHSLTNVRPMAQGVFDFLRRFAQAEPDLVVLDPPREGAAANVLSLLARLRPKHILYLSCCPPTLARDLNCLTRRGYSVDSVDLFDFFPQTFHIESLVRLSAGYNS